MILQNERIKAYKELDDFMKRQKGLFGRPPSRRKLKSLRKDRARYDQQYYVDRAIKRLEILQDRSAGEHTIQLAINDEATNYALDYLGLRIEGKDLEKRKGIKKITEERTIAELEKKGFDLFKAKFKSGFKLINFLVLGYSRIVFYDQRDFMTRKISKAFEKIERTN